MTIESLEHAIVASAPTAELTAILVDVAETGVDQFLADGPLRDIPVIASVLGLRRSLTSFRDYLFLKRVARFLLATQSITVEERAMFLADAEGDPRRVGEVLVTLLDRMDDLRKPELLAKLFAARVRGELSLSDFQRLAIALDRVLLADLPLLRSFSIEPPRMSRDPHPQFELLEQLTVTGLIMRETASGPVGGRHASYRMTAAGTLFLKVLFPVA